MLLSFVMIAQPCRGCGRDEWADQIAPGTPIEITVREPATTPTVSLGQIRRWCDGVAVSLDDVLKRQRVKDLIGA